MEMKKLMSIAIAFAMLAVSFAMVNTAKAQVSDSDNTTQITVNAVFPKLYWIGFNDTGFNSQMETQVAVETDYLFGFQYNYSRGWDACDFIVQAWYDRGNTGLASSYPAVPTDNDRNLAFEIYCDPLDATPFETYVNLPGGELEIISTGPAIFTNLSDNPYAGQDNYTVYIPVTFGSQIRAAEYGGVAPIGPDYSRDKLVSLNNAYSWDFSITVRDRAQTTATNRSYGEFGVQMAVSISASGNPTGNAPPGGSTVLEPYTSITYSSNTPYFVNVTLQNNLLLNGVGPVNIPTTNLFVQNVHGDANVANSEISGPLNIPAPLTERYVWGLPATPIAPSGHGTISAGPLDSDFTTPGTVTELEWSVNVPAVQEGVYWTFIIVTIYG
jgi:hypothetical protein